MKENTASSVSWPLLFLGWPEGRGHPGGPGPAPPTGQIIGEEETRGRDPGVGSVPPGVR